MNNVSNRLVDYISRFLDDTSEADIMEIASVFSHFELSKNDLLVKEGSDCEYFCFIETGILQHYLTISEEEKTTYLGLKNSVTTALNSFKNQIPSRKNIRALSDCVLWVIDQKQFSGLLKENNTFYRFYHNLIEQQIFLIDDYRIDLLTKTPEDRYKKLLSNEPSLLQEVPLHYLASFLRISSRHMSRIRKNII